MAKHTTQTKMRRYRIGPSGHYRDGMLYPQGSFIDLPEPEMITRKVTKTTIVNGMAVQHEEEETVPDPLYIPPRDAVEVEMKDEVDEDGKPIKAGPLGIQQRAENPNPLPPTPATSKSFQGQGQFIPKGEDEKTVGELREAEQRGEDTTKHRKKRASDETPI